MWIAVSLDNEQETALVGGDTVTVTVDPQQMLTVSQAARLLNVYRYQLIELTEQGEIPITEGVRLQRVKLADVIAYDRKRRAQQRAILDQMVRESQEWDYYPGITLDEAVAAQKNIDKENA